MSNHHDSKTMASKLPNPLDTVLNAWDVCLATSWFGYSHVAKNSARPIHQLF
jgi:hypothetical protein